MTIPVVRSVGVLCLTLSLLTASNSVFAAAPVNDICSGAEVIPASGPFPYQTSTTDITLATTTGDPVALCGDSSQFSRSLWYKFAPAVSGPYLISTCPTAPTGTTVDDTVMAIFTSVNGCTGPFTQIAGGCADDSCDLAAAITATLSAGTTYYIVVWRYGIDTPPPDNASLQLLVDRAIPPPNDKCAGAIDLPLNFRVRGTTTSGIDDYRLAPSCFDGTTQPVTPAGGRDVVYSFTAPAAGNYSFRVSNFDINVSDPLLYAIDTCPVGPSPVTINSCLGIANRTRFGASEEVFCLSLSAGRKIFLVVDDSVTNSPGSTFFIEANVCLRETEPNNTTLTAEPLVFGIEGAIDSNGDVDFYSLGTPTFGSRFFALVDGAALATSDLELRVINGLGTVEFDTGNNDPIFGNLSPNVAGTVLSNTPTYLRIERQPGPSEPYRVYSVIQPPLTEATPETEPNGTLGQANFALNNYFYGNLAGPSPSLDVDNYQFDANQGDLIFVSLDGDPQRNNTPIDAAVGLLDEVGNLLVGVDDFANSSVNSPNSSTNSNQYPSAPAEGLVYRASVTGTYYARVSVGSRATGSAGAGDYLLSICRNGVPGSDGRPSDALIESMSLLPNGHLQLFVQGTQGVTYRLLWSDDLINWSIVPKGGGIPGSDGLFQFEDANPTASQRFYRVVWP
jgi:hypothetical protein